MSNDYGESVDEGGPPEGVLCSFALVLDTEPER